MKLPRNRFSPGPPTPTDPTRIAIGIFAHNEESTIVSTLESLASQSLLQEAHGNGHHIHISVLANGCTDHTVQQAQAALGTLLAPVRNCSFSIETLPFSGKSRTWNAFVHHIADARADYLLFMDADIQIIGPRSLDHLLATLHRTPEAHAAVDTILKDVALAPNPNFRQRLSTSASALQSNGPPKIAGSLYLLRASLARSLWLPFGLLVEDGFLKALLTTNQFTAPESPSRIVHAAAACHTFQAQLDPLTLLRHERRLLLGTAQNILLFKHLRSLAVTVDSPSNIAAWIHSQNEINPDWLDDFTRLGFKDRGLRVLPWKVLQLPFRPLKGLSLLGKIRTLPICIARFLLNASALAAAAIDIRQGRLRW